MGISQRFAERQGEGRSVLVPYVTCGFPSSEASVDVLSTIAEAGGDILELGIPFSDPLAEGPTIQMTSYRALQNGVTLETVLEVATRLRASQPRAPLILMGYYNPLLQFGVDEFVLRARDS